MNKQITEQIKKIKGVKTVEPFETTDRVVVTFEAELTSVHVTNLEQLDFMWLKYYGEKHGTLMGDQICVYAEGGESEESGWNYMRNARKDSRVIPFSQYLTDYNLTDEWEKYLLGEAEKRYPVGTKSQYSGEVFTSTGEFSVYKNGDIYHRVFGRYRDTNGKWAEIIPNEVELVEGEIYYDCEKNDCIKNIFRHKAKNKVYSRLFIESNNFESNTSVHLSSIIKPATKKQKQKLIRAEIKNGYFHELRSKDS